jgi:hypothetical protein
VKRFAELKNGSIFAAQSAERHSQEKIVEELVAQPVEHLTFNQRVLGSNPSQFTSKIKRNSLVINELFFFVQNENLHTPQAQLNNFHVLKFSIHNFEPHQRFYFMKTFVATSPRIDVQQTMNLIGYNFQYMRMSTDK